MNINWKIRFKNPVFVGQLVAAIVLPLIVGVGLSWSDMTSWATLGETLIKAINNPVVVVSMILSVYNALIDPTTKGMSDSVKALEYDEPAV